VRRKYEAEKEYDSRGNDSTKRATGGTKNRQERAPEVPTKGSPHFRGYHVITGFGASTQHPTAISLSLSLSAQVPHGASGTLAPYRNSPGIRSGYKDAPIPTLSKRLSSLSCRIPAVHQHLVDLQTWIPHTYRERLSNDELEEQKLSLLHQMVQRQGASAGRSHTINDQGGKHVVQSCSETLKHDSLFFTTTALLSNQSTFRTALDKTSKAFLGILLFTLHQHPHPIFIQCPHRPNRYLQASYNPFSFAWQA